MLNLILTKALWLGFSSCLSSFADVAILIPYPVSYLLLSALSYVSWRRLVPATARLRAQVKARWLCNSPCICLESASEVFSPSLLV